MNVVLVIEWLSGVCVTKVEIALVIWILGMVTRP